MNTSCIISKLFHQLEQHTMKTADFRDTHSVFS